LVERGLAETGAKAQALIMAGQVRIVGRPHPKPGDAVPPDLVVEVLPGPRYVSRGGEKLEGALRTFGVNPAGVDALDIGASTGGFIDCLLQHGARRVVGVDVGHGQLHWKLRNDPRVVNLEKTHILRFTRDDLAKAAPGFETALVTVDVSFISLERVLSPVGALIAPGTTLIALVKPQFEVGPKGAPKGVVRDEALRESAVRRII
jgi:23S rRNA (cytidine1920-2'-O)/16S rRNA (cytidine1409-2'-O)-methyltransferase